MFFKSSGCSEMLSAYIAPHHVVFILHKPWTRTVNTKPQRRELSYEKNVVVCLGSSWQNKVLNIISKAYSRSGIMHHFPSLCI